MATCPTCRTRYPDDATTCTADGDRLLPDEMVTDDADLPAGQTVGEYRVEVKIGEGGFGAVYRAVHPLIGKAAAIKVLNKQYSSNPQMVSRFVAEARAVNQIQNRNIIDIFSFGALPDGRQYYVMELLDGKTLDAYRAGQGAPRAGGGDPPAPRHRPRARRGARRRHRPPRPEAREHLPHLRRGRRGLPQAARLRHRQAARRLRSAGHKTRTGTPMGTPHYMSPEQCRGRNVDARTDIYSFGVLALRDADGQGPLRRRGRDGDPRQAHERARAPALRRLPGPAAGARRGRPRLPREGAGRAARPRSGPGSTPSRSPRRPRAST